MRWCRALLMVPYLLVLASCSSPQDASSPLSESPPPASPSAPAPDPVPPPPAEPAPQPVPPVPAPLLPPSSHYDLSHWKLTLPVDAAGGVSGVAREITDLQGYSSKYFHTAEDGGLVFRVGVNGATTRNSHYPRSELRQMLDPSTGTVNWPDSRRGILEADLKIDRLPQDGRFIVGQIHGFNSPRPLLKLQYEFKAGLGTVTALLNQSPQSERSMRMPLATAVPLHEVFSYRVEVRNRKLYLSVNDASPQSYAIDPSWQSYGLFFKAGVYLQASGSSTTDYGQATFYWLSATHPADSP